MGAVQKPFIIGITGGSGAGKTTLVRALRDYFSEEELCIISQDDYYLPRDQQEPDKRGVKNFDRPKSIDREAFARDIQKLIAGETVTIKEYTFNNPHAEARLITLKPAPVIIVEGLFVLHIKRIRKLLDLKVFVQAKENIKLIRRIIRDQQERNYPLEDVLYRYRHHVMPTYEKYIRPHIDRADIVINNNDQMENGIRILKAFIREEAEKRRAASSATRPKPGE